MELKAYFYGIHKVIIEHLEKAQSEIAVAVAWFTDRDIFDVLCRKAQTGIKLTVVLIGDEINRGPGGLNFRRLQNLGGKVVFLPSGNRSDPVMHHKFCVIDSVTVITGSYNWSQKARSNDENITVATGNESFAMKYLEAFHDLLKQAEGSLPTADGETIRRRLELIKNLVLLGERDEVASHVRKLRQISGRSDLKRIAVALDEGQYKSALEQIEGYLHRASALIVADEVDVGRLRFDLLVLELRLESLSDEKADLERRLIAFNRRHDDVLGDLIQRILLARAEVARIKASQQLDKSRRKYAEAAAREAEEAYSEYSRQHEELQKEAPPPRLSGEDERELKSLYRKACSLCHPDKFPEAKKSAAHQVFTDLQDAYKRNDLARVREIYESLAAGGLPDIRSATLSRADELRAAIAELEYAISTALATLKAMRASDAFMMMDSAGASEDAWAYYFEERRVLLSEELESLVLQLQAARHEGDRVENGQ